MGLRTFLMLTHELLREVNSPVQKATVFDAQQAINDAYRDINQYYNWTWLIDRYDIPIFPSYTTGTISTTIGSPIVTGVGTGWNTTTWWNKKIILPNTNSGYEIARFNSPTQLTLRFPFNAGAALTNAAYTIYQDDYPSPVISGRDFLFTNPAWQNARLDKIDLFTMRDRTAFQFFQAVQGPTVVTDSGTDWNPLSPTYQQPRFQFWPIPSSTQVIVLTYYRLPPPLALDTDLTILPPEFEEILIKLGRYRLKKKFGIVGWMEDMQTSMQTLVQFREKQAQQSAYDQRPGSMLWPYNDGYSQDMSMGMWPGRLNP